MRNLQSKSLALCALVMFLYTDLYEVQTGTHSVADDRTSGERHDDVRTKRKRFSTFSAQAVERQRRGMDALCGQPER